MWLSDMTRNREQNPNQPPLYLKDKPIFKEKLPSTHHILPNARIVINARWWTVFYRFDATLIKPQGIMGLFKADESFSIYYSSKERLRIEQEGMEFNAFLHPEDQLVTEIESQ